MKINMKLLILLNIVVYSLIIFACNTTTIKKENTGKEEKLSLSKEVIIIDQEKYIKQNISNLIKKAYYIKTGNIYKSNNNHQTYVDMIYFGSEYFGIDYKNLIVIITIESEWNPLCYHKNNNGTEDFGIAQINNCHINSNFVIAKKICDKFKIKYIDSYYDINLNILSAFIYLNDSRNELIALKDFNNMRWISSYNCGVSGSIKYKESADKYWNKFNSIRSML